MRALFDLVEVDYLPFDLNEICRFCTRNSKPLALKNNLRIALGSDQWCAETPSDGGGAFWPNDQQLLVKKERKRSQKILLPTLLQHGCLLTNFIANVKTLGRRDAPLHASSRHIHGSDTTKCKNIALLHFCSGLWRSKLSTKVWIISTKTWIYPIDFQVKLQVQS